MGGAPRRAPLLRVAIARVDDPALAWPADRADGPDWLGAAERARWATLRDAARPAFVASRALARRLLADLDGVPASRWVLSAQPGTAPRALLREDEGAGECGEARDGGCELEGEGEGEGDGDGDGDGEDALGPVHAPPSVSLAHRLGWVAAAVADAALGPVGIDVECEHPARSDPGERAALMLCARELAAWSVLAPGERADALLRAWVAKEAWFKSAPAGTAPWDFRRVAVAASAPANANLRVWSGAGLHLGVCCADAGALAAAHCAGVDAAGVHAATFWRVAQAD